MMKKAKLLNACRPSNYYYLHERIEIANQKKRIFKNDDAE